MWWSKKGGGREVQWSRIRGGGGAIFSETLVVTESAVIVITTHVMDTKGHTSEV